MVSSSPDAHPLRLRRRGVRHPPIRAAVRRWMRRARAGLPSAAECVSRRLSPACLVASLRRAVERALQIGLQGPLSVDIRKRIRLCNLLALWGTAIMVPWTAVELAFGEARDLPSELASLVGFLAVLSLNAARAYRAARFLLIAIANGCVLAGALLFDPKAGGTLPFFALVALPLLLFGPTERRMLVLGAALPVVLFVACDTGVAARLLLRLLSIRPLPAPSWYFAANVISAFAVAFVVPFFFYRSNLRAEASLERMGREKLKRVIDSNLIGVVRGRLSGCIEEANDTFLSLLGYSRPDLATGSVDLKTIAPLDPHDFGCARSVGEPAGLGAATSVYERTFHRKDGAAVPVLVGVALLDESEDEVVGFVLDLTAQKSVEAQNAMLRESHEALRLRDLFNSIASHELKTPLTALLLNLKTLRRRLDREASENAGLRMQVDRCEVSALRMGDLIHTLLDVAQIHDGKMKLAIAEMDVVEAVRRIVGDLEANWPGGVQIHVCADGPVTARLDSLRFDQIVTNLLSNAIKYGAGKPIEVRVGHDGAADVAHLEVIDHGPGIAPGMTEKIFEPFQRAVAAEEPIPGLGLGLYVVKMIVDEHGGRINVESRPGEGSRFVVDLPCARAAAGAESSSVAPPPS